MIEIDKNIKTPYYLVDESKLLKNLEKISLLKERTGAKSVLALKCFSTWSVFDLMKQYMDGTTSSSLYEAKLGAEKFGKEVHSYSVAWTEEEILEVKKFSSKIIFNSISQLKRLSSHAAGVPIGLRVNPGVSHSNYILADPARQYSRLGESNFEEVMANSSAISGVMFHCNCDNDEIDSFSRILSHISKKYTALLEKVEWVSLGGGTLFTKEGYPFDRFCQIIKDFSDKHKVQIYLEPGEAAITKTGYLVTSVMDIVRNEKEIAIVDAAVETHMLDLLIYELEAKMEMETGTHEYMIAGRTCLAGDIFGTYKFPEKLGIGSNVIFADASGYTMVKKNWFNGVQMPSIVVKRLNGKFETIRTFSYEDYRDNLS